ncbi:glycosyltransferase [Litchfieldia salsa]|nr:glycosyltransferase [Litchfieldia salsa]
MKTIVIVIYKQDIHTCKTIESLKQALNPTNMNLKEIEVILYDHSPEKQKVEQDLLEGVKLSYIHDQRNLGIATAYNFAWNKAVENQSEWLLLFDHDTKVTQEYIEEVLKVDCVDDEVAAIVPMIKNADTIISPLYTGKLRPLLAERPTEGTQAKPVMAINSGSLIRVSFLNKIEGFNLEFPLDYLDHWLFHEIYAKGFKVNVLNVTLEHDLSVMDYRNVSLSRYKSILDSEVLFYKKYKRELYSAYRIQLLKRIIKQVVTVKNKKIAFYTIRQIFTM